MGQDPNKICIPGDQSYELSATVMVIAKCYKAHSATPKEEQASYRHSKHRSVKRPSRACRGGEKLAQEWWDWWSPSLLDPIFCVGLQSPIQRVSIASTELRSPTAGIKSPSTEKISGGPGGGIEYSCNHFDSAKPTSITKVRIGLFFISIGN